MTNTTAKVPHAGQTNPGHDMLAAGARVRLPGRQVLLCESMPTRFYADMRADHLRRSPCGRDGASIRVVERHVSAMGVSVPVFLVLVLKLEASS